MNKATKKSHKIHRQSSLTIPIIIAVIISNFYIQYTGCAQINNFSSNEIDTTQLTDDVIQVRVNEPKPLNVRCGEALRSLDRCSAKLIGLGSDNTSLPISMGEMNSDYCPRLKDINNCIKDSTACFKPFEKQIVNWILSSSRKMNNKRCKSEDEKQKFIKLTQSCLSIVKPQTDECMSNYIGSLEALANLSENIEHLSEDDIQIQLSCCANSRFKQCIIDNASQKCKPLDSLNKLRRTNSVSSQRNVHRYIQKLMSDTMDDLRSTLDAMTLTGPELICGSVDEKFCRKNFDGRFQGRVARSKSIVPAMIRIYSNKW